MARPPAVEQNTAVSLTLNRMPQLENKMKEYAENGCRLGWLLDPIENFAILYRPGQPPERIDEPKILSGEPVLPGFQFDFKEIL